MESKTVLPVPIIEHQFELAPEFKIQSYFFSNVMNAAELKEIVKSYHETGNNTTVESMVKTNSFRNGMIAFLDLDVLAGQFTLLSAANKAILSHVENTRKTESLGTEFLYNLSPSRSIKYALETFGTSAKTKRLAVVIFEHRDKKVSCEDVGKILSVVRGTIIVDTVELWEMSIELKEGIKKMYKVMDSSLDLGSLDDAVALNIAMRDVK